MHYRFVLPRTFPTRHHRSWAARCGAVLGLTAACNPVVEPPRALELVVTTDEEEAAVRTHLDLTMYATVGCETEGGWSHFTVWQAGEQVAQGDAEGPRPWTVSVELTAVPNPPSALGTAVQTTLVVRGHCGDGREVEAEPLPLPPTVVARAEYPAAEQHPAVLTVEADGTWLGCRGALVRYDITGETLARAELARPCILGDTVRVLDDAVVVEYGGGAVEIVERETLEPRWQSPPAFVAVDPDGQGAVTATYAPAQGQSHWGSATVSRWSLVDADSATAPTATWDVGDQVDDSTFTPRAVGWDGAHAFLVGDRLPRSETQARTIERWSIGTNGAVTRAPLLELDTGRTTYGHIGVFVTDDASRVLVVADDALRLIDMSDATVLFQEPSPGSIEVRQAEDLWVGTGDALLRIDRDGNVVARTAAGWHVAAVSPTGGAFLYRVGYEPATRRVDASLEPMWTLPHQQATAAGFDAQGRAYVHSGRAESLFAL